MAIQFSRLVPDCTYTKEAAATERDALRAQVPGLVRMAKQALAEGKCVVIGLQSTGEARTVDVIAERGEELDDFVSGPKVGCRLHI